MWPYVGLLFSLMVSHSTAEENASNSSSHVYVNKWYSLDSRPAPEWFDRAKLGIMVHWGVYSVPAFCAGNRSAEYFWQTWEDGHPAIIKFLENNYPKVKTYEDLAALFTAEDFDADDWAKIFADAGAKYVILTTKHYDGFALFPSLASGGFDSTHIGPKLDIVNEVSGAVDNLGLKFGIHYALYEFFDPAYQADVKTHFKTQIYPTTKLWPDLNQLVVQYRPKVLQVDFSPYNAAPDLYGNWKGFLSWLYSSSSVKDSVVVNDKWSQETVCKHGDFFTCGDNYSPTTLQHHKWERSFSLDWRSWGYRRDMMDDDVVTSQEIIRRLVMTVSMGGNMLVSVGATKEGNIPQIFKDRLRELGSWLKINGEAIYGTSPWFHQKDPESSSIWYTCVKTPYNRWNPTAVPSGTDVVKSVYAVLLRWPEDNVARLSVKLPLATDLSVELLDGNVTLEWKKLPSGTIEVPLPPRRKVQSRHAWVLRVRRLSVSATSDLETTTADLLPYIVTYKRGLI